MYLRFIAPAPRGRWTVTRSHVDPGLFRSGYDLWSGDRNDPVKIAIREELDWFNANLPVPNRVAVKSKGRWYHDGVCWFRDSAREMLAHAYTLAALIEDSGIRIDRLRSERPGQILYRDDWQVVAMPDRYRRVRSIPPPAGLLSLIRRWVCRGLFHLSPFPHPFVIPSPLRHSRVGGKPAAEGPPESSFAGPPRPRG